MDNKMILYFSNLMIVFYLIAGIMLLFTKIAIEFFPSNRIGFGLFLVVYGLFRAYINYRKNQSES
jgi:hypothetical protein